MFPIEILARYFKKDISIITDSSFLIHYWISFQLDFFFLFFRSLPRATPTSRTTRTTLFRRPGCQSSCCVCFKTTRRPRIRVFADDSTNAWRPSWTRPRSRLSLKRFSTRTPRIAFYSKQSLSSFTTTGTAAWTIFPITQHEQRV